MRRTLFHVACCGAAAAAAWATLSTGLMKATKLASRTICNSPFAARRIAASSSDAKAAPRLGWRSVRACRRFSGTKSCTKAAPLTFAGRSTRGTLRPTTLYDAAGFAAAVPVTAWLRSISWATVQ